MHTLVSLPTYDEAENIRPLVRALLDLELDLEVMIVDDASPDGTGRIADEIGATTRRVHVHHRKEKLGLGSAHVTAFRFGLASGAQHVVTMDADFSHSPAAVPALLAGMRDHDVMIGSRYVPGGRIENWSLARRVLSGTANRLSRSVLRLPVRDCTGGFRCYSRRVLETINPRSIRAEGYSFQEEMLFHCHRAGFRIGEVPITFVDRRYGRSKISRREVHRALATILRLAARGR